MINYLYNQIYKYLVKIIRPLNARNPFKSNYIITFIIINLKIYKNYFIV